MEWPVAPILLISIKSKAPECTYLTKENIPYPSVVAARVLSEDDESPCAYGSINATTYPLLESSMAMFDKASLDL